MNPGNKPQTWSSPAFLKRSQLPYATYFKTQYDSEGIFEDSGRTKKLRFGRNSDQWAFTDVLPSPGRSDTQSPVDSKSVSPTPYEPVENQGASFKHSAHPSEIEHTPPNTDDRDQLSPVEIKRSFLSDNERTKLNDNDQHEVSPVQGDADAPKREFPAPTRNDDEGNMQSLQANVSLDKSPTVDNTSDSPEAKCDMLKETSSQTGIPRQVEFEPDKHNSPEDEPTPPQEFAQESLLDPKGDNTEEKQRIQALPTDSESFSNITEQERSEATEAGPNTYVVPEGTPGSGSGEASPGPNSVDAVSIIAQSNSQQDVYTGPIISTGCNISDQVDSVIELSSGDSEDNEEIQDNKEDEAIQHDEDRDEDVQSEDDEELEYDEEIEDEAVSEAEEVEIEDFEDEDNSDDEDSESSGPTSPRGYHLVHPSRRPRYLDLTTTDSDDESEMDAMEIDEASLEEDYGSISPESSVVDELDEDSSQNLSESDSLAALTASESKSDRDTSVRESGAHLDDMANSLNVTSDVPGEKNNDLVVNEVNQLSLNTIVSKTESREAPNINNQSLDSLPLENGLSNDLPMCSEGTLNSKQQETPRRRSSELHISEVSPEDEQSRHDGFLPDNVFGQGPTNEDTDMLASSPGQFEEPLVGHGIGLRTGNTLSKEANDLCETKIAIDNVGASKGLDQSTETDSPGKYPEAFRPEHQKLHERDSPNAAEFADTAADEGATVNNQVEMKRGNLSPKKQQVEIIDLESEDGDYGPETWVKPGSSPNPAGADSSYKIWPEEASAGGMPDTRVIPSDVSGHEGHIVTSHRGTSMSTENNEENGDEMIHTIPQTPIMNSDPPIAGDSPFEEDSHDTRSGAPYLLNADFLRQPSTATMKADRLGDLNTDSTFGEQLATPRATQQRGVVLESSPVSSQSIEEQHSIVTPELTQDTLVPPLALASPKLPPKQSVVEKIRAMKNLSTEMARARSSNIMGAVGSWFVAKKESQMTHVSDSENEVTSEVEREAISARHIIIDEDEEQREEQRDNEEQNEVDQDETDNDEVDQDGSDQDEVHQDKADLDEANLDEKDLDEAIQDEAVHDKAVHDEAVHDEAVQDEAVQDEADHDEAVQDEADHDEAVQDEADHDEAVQDEADHDEVDQDVVYRDEKGPDEGQDVEEQDEEERDGGQEDDKDHYLIDRGHHDSPGREITPRNRFPSISAANSSASSQHPGFRTSLSYFAPLSTICNHFHELIDTLVIVLSSTDIVSAQTGPRHWLQTISIIDPSSSSTSSHPHTIAQIFRPYKAAFPSVRQGDAILLRDFKVQSFQNRLGLLSTDSSAWAVFRKGVDVQIQGPPVEFGAEERGFARGLWDWWGSVGAEVRKCVGEPATAAATAGETAGETTDSPRGRGGTPEADEADDADDGSEIITPTKKGRSTGRKRGRPPLGQGVVRHELRDGSSYTNSPRRGKGSVHELRDGTTYSDSVEP